MKQIRTSRTRIRVAERIAAGDTTLEEELYRLRQHEQYLTLAGFQSGLHHGARILRGSVHDLEADHCDVLEALFQDVQRGVGRSILAFEAPDLALLTRPYALLLKLWLLHRELVEVQVLVRGVRGLCGRGRLATDPTGSYWHLRHALASIMRGHRALLVLLGVEVSVRTDTPYSRFSDLPVAASA